MKMHLAFRTIGLLTWLLIRKETINDIFQIRGNAAHEVMEVAKSHLHRDYLDEKDKATKILDDLEGELDADLVTTSRQLVLMHTESYLGVFTEELSTRREWLITHQPTTTEAISMKPDGFPTGVGR